MFNGIIYKIGKIKSIKKTKQSIYICIQTSIKFKKNEIGSSISCNGVCLTLVNIKMNFIYFYVSLETLKRSNFKFLKIGNIINLEKSLIYGQKISGHFTQGHVDTTAKVNKILFIDKTWLIRFNLIEKKYSKFLLEKASISINGVSLTISKVKNRFFEVNTIPHTLKLTNLKYLKKNSVVNIELDIFGKYISKI